MKNRQLAFVWTVLLVITVTVASCGGGESPTETSAPTATRGATATPAATPTPAPTATPENAVSALEDVERATVRIEAQGSFVEPGAGLQLNIPGSGSGFIIDESGIAVTNNHVVTGAALLQVYVGEENKARNAKVLGVSECSDLAVIDIDGDGFPYLEWYDGAISVGLDVYAAGFPLGDPEFTVTRGIVSKERADGETNWASVDAVVEHDATINPGNSGGPLITSEGLAIGVNYAGNSGTDQYFAIARDEAIEILEQLRAGQNVTSIGVNGQAVNDGEGLSGIWVSSVQSGSPADRAGLEGGDIITKLEGLVLATDGTMADYCDILRSRDATDTLDVEVLRLSTEEVLEGQINGRELEQSFSFAQEFGNEVDDGGDSAYSGYTIVSDDSGAIQVSIPQEWTDIDGSAWVLDEETVGATVSASRNLSEFYDTFATPGVFFGASDVLAASYDAGSFLDELPDFSADCTYEGRSDYEDSVYTGLFDHYTDCGGVGSQIINIVAFPASGELVVWVQTQIVSEADLDALDEIINSFDVVGALPSGAGSPPSGSGDVPGATARYDGGIFSVDYPESWEESSLDMLGLAMTIFASKELSMDEIQDLDFEGMVADDPVVIIMVVPEDMAADMGFEDIDSAIDEFDDTIPSDDVEIIEQGDTTIGGAPGRLVIAKGTDPDMGEVGMHLVAARTEDGTVIVFMGATPEDNLQQNLDIFEQMQRSFQFN
jgi:serine protease Do